MRSTTSYITAIFIAAALTAAPLAAQGHGKGPAAPKPAIHTQGHSPAAHGKGAKPTKPAKPTTPERKASTKSAAVQEHLANQPQLAAKLGTLLPGMTVSQAATDFQSLGHFVAAVHVSHNLDIPFLTLKSRVTGPNAVSLGQAIHDLKPDANAHNEVRRAEAEAREDMKTGKR